MNSSLSIQPDIAPALATCFSIEAAAQQLGIGRTFVYALIKQGRLASVKLGRRRLIPIAAIKSLIEEGQGVGRVA
ncbi:excisionase family DNA-binding protein [Geothrix mesophila]|uniref:excisionase family DNA-binding protein n=1 Tax=Geothrix mesophila TaxID=2922723 RepID=UPI001FAD584F|nr:excisionase family DNA-binding protein [Geothrix sp. SG198]